MSIVISGIGVVSALGAGDAHWRRVAAGESAILPLAGPEPWPIAVGARADGFDVRPYLADRKMARLLSPAAGFVFAAAGLAVADAAGTAFPAPFWTGLDPTRRGLFCQTGMFQVESADLAPIVANCCEGGSLSLSKFGEKGMSVINPFLPIKTLPNMGLGALSIHFDMQGPNLVAGPFGVQGAVLLDLAMAALEDDMADVCVVAGGDSPFNMMTLTTWLAMGLLDTRAHPAYAPFHADNMGVVLGEGGVALVLEREADVAKRGGRAYARVAHVATACAATSPAHAYPTDGDALRHVVGQALAGGPPAAWYPEACGMPATDALEAQVMRELLGDLAPSSSKPAVGTWPGAGVLLETAAAARGVASHRRRALVGGMDPGGGVAAIALDPAGS